ncbi:hypothetical protein [Coprococcus sp. AM11-30B]|uniref:hypothetical protein n=1 Tax=Coprococcus sp. AM11-30B TaxID=2997950 RepID=UPI0022DFAD1D|nr:hypothetical protein [Coprococcus sp. AM11-30B]
MKKFDALKMVTDEQKFSELVFDMVSECKTAEKLTDLLREELPEKELQTMKSITQSGYPLSFGNNNVCNV